MADIRKSNPSLRLTSIKQLRSVFGIKGRLTLSRGLIRRNIWVLPVLALVALIFAGTWLRTQIEQAMAQQAEEELRALLDADVTALELWFQSQEANAMAVVQAPAVRKSVLDLLKMAEEGKTTAADLLQAPQRAEFAAALKPWLDSYGYTGYLVIDMQEVVLTAKADSLVGQKSLPGYSEFAEAVFAGRGRVSRPFPSIAVMPDEWGRVTAGVPTMLVGAPFLDDAGKTIALVALRIRPDQEFTRILNVARFGKSGETYAFDKQGLLLSRSRFQEGLKDIGLLADQEYARSELTIELRDPGVDLTQREVSALRRSEQPLTRMAQSAVQGNSGVDVVGYRDYRGVPTIGAWTWLKNYDMGVVTEVDIAEAFRPLYILRAVFWGLFFLLGLAALAMLGLTLLAGRLEKRVREAVVAAGQLGQYALEEKIGEGGMGSVYRARHALLRRPTAVKLLEPGKTTELSIARFEREVQLTSQLNHPNTITIYDYGRTQEGVFYYAMEYLDGFSLQSLVDRFGPQGDGRVTQILLQVCGSLIEAHALDLVHRDIKPANIMLSRRGGMKDFVKLLDFGLVKALDTRRQTALTSANSITGTPLYLPPENIKDADAADGRSDLYSLGAVGYFLLTGHPVFEGNNVMEIIRQQVESKPVSPSQRLGRPVSVELERLLLKCLAKEPADRPQTAGEMADALALCVPLQPWTAADSERWWNQYQPVVKSNNESAATQDIDLSNTIGYTTAGRKA